MLTPFDDYLCHQTLDHVEIPATSDLRFFSRYFATFYSRDGRFAAITGIGRYANTKVMDGYAVVVHAGEQRNLRASRPLEHDPHVQAVGPIHIEILEPLRTFRLRCDDNDLGFSYDLICETIARPFERRPRYRARVNGRLTENTMHFNQGYRCRGRITWDGERIDVTASEFFGARDHSWGTGRFWDGPYVHGPTGPGEITDPRGDYGNGEFPAGDGRWTEQNLWVLFVDGGECYVTFSLKAPAHLSGGELIQPWDSTDESVKLIGLERRNVEFDHTTKQFASCDLTLTDANGRDHEMRVRRLTTAYHLGCPYGDLDSEYRMGKPMGHGVHLEGEKWPVDADLPHRSYSLNICEYRWRERVGFGTFELSAPHLAERPFAKFVPPTSITRDPSLRA